MAEFRDFDDALKSIEQARRERDEAKAEVERLRAAIAAVRRELGAAHPTSRLVSGLKRAVFTIDAALKGGG